MKDFIKFIEKRLESFRLDQAVSFYTSIMIGKIIGLRFVFS